MPWSALGGLLALALSVATSACARNEPAKSAPVAVAPKPTASETPPQVAANVECPVGSQWDGHACMGELVCPEGAHIEDGRCVAEAVEPPPPPPPPEVAEQLPSVQVASNGRDPRKSSAMPRARALLVTELQGLEALYASTPKNAPDRPALLRRLAEDYVELERSAEKDPAPNSAKVVSAARKKAIEDYRHLRDEYPGYPRLDDVLYYAGYEYERAGDRANARAMYRELVMKFPSSPHVARLPAGLRPSGH